MSLFVSVIAVVLLFAGFIAPYDPAEQSRTTPNAPASNIRILDAEGTLHLRPFVYRRELMDPLSVTYAERTERNYPIRLLVKGSSYSVLGLFEASIHLFGIEGEDVRLNLLGTDALGRDRFSRLIVGTRFSLFVAIFGVLFAGLLGTVIGAVSGFAPRVVDVVLMSVTDTVLALPALIVILAARLAFPLELPPVSAAVLLVAIFALTGWAEIARLARGLVRSIREQEFVTAARASGTSESAILFRHILPNVLPTIVTQATLILPHFLLAEVALSFLGVGVQEPAPSLGNLLAAAADLGGLRSAPFLLLSPAFVIVIFVLGVRLATRGLRAGNLQN